MEIYFFPGILESQVMSVTLLAKSWEQQEVKDACKLSQQNLSKLLMKIGSGYEEIPIQTIFCRVTDGLETVLDLLLPKEMNGIFTKLFKCCFSWASHQQLSSQPLGT